MELHAFVRDDWYCDSSTTYTILNLVFFVSRGGSTRFVSGDEFVNIPVVAIASNLGISVVDMRRRPAWRPARLGARVTARRSFLAEKCNWPTRKARAPSRHSSPSTAASTQFMLLDRKRSPGDNFKAVGGRLSRQNLGVTWPNRFSTETLKTNKNYVTGSKTISSC